MASSIPSFKTDLFLCQSRRVKNFHKLLQIASQTLNINFEVLRLAFVVAEGLPENPDSVLAFPVDGDATQYSFHAVKFEITKFFNFALVLLSLARRVVLFEHHARRDLTGLGRKIFIPIGDIYFERQTIRPLVRIISPSYVTVLL